MIPRTDFSPIAEGSPHVEIRFRLAVAKIRYFEIVDVDRKVANLDARARRHEPSSRCIDRLIKLAEYPGIGADLHVREQLRTQLIDFGQHKPRCGVVVAVALEVIL